MLRYKNINGPGNIFPKFSLLICLFLLSASFAFSQVPSGEEMGLAGIYNSAEDFRNGRLTYEVDCVKEKQKIRLHNFKPYIEVVYKGEKVKLQKTAIFGYKNCQGNVFRFYCGDEYALAERRAISIYFTEQEISFGSSLINERLFYFSSEIDGPLLPLSVENLKRAYPGNKKFCALLDSKVSKDSDLWMYDEQHAIFYANSLYNISLQ